MSKRTLFLGALGLAVLAAVFLLREPDPQAVLRQAAKNLLAEKTFRAELRMTIVGALESFGSAVVANATSIDIVGRSDIDRTDPARPASVSTFEVRQELAVGGQAKLAGEARRKDGVHYLRLEEADGMEGFEPSRLVDTWMKTDRPFLDLLRGVGASEPPLDAVRLEALRSAMESVDIFTVVQKLPKEELNGARAFHYAVEVNMEAVSALLLKRRELRSGRQVGTQDVLEVTEELVRWNKPVGEVWIDAKTRKLKQITLGTAFGSDGKSGAAAGTLVFSHEGKPVVVEAPQAEDAEKVLGALFPKRLSLAGSRPLSASGTLSRTQAAALPMPDPVAGTSDSDDDGLSDAQEFFYGADAWNPDTDADGYADGLEVDKGMNPIGPGPLFSFGL